ncbi:DNA ligase [Pontibacterium granulatum]|uniref:DNA ligase n=1 Tax=Pontibacterium granulatum TaxID=2036029 RepID=UPI00249B4EB3|nr:DNA ligase [Pontibacterium granulatum]MDI3325985.1 DNA ligase [Pontibacterium granulatum]
MFYLRLLVLWAGLFFASFASAEKPELQLANVYERGLDVSRYWVSEKLDGVRGYWDGKHLLSRSGRPITAPAWFTEGLPDHPLDGELWIGRGKFEAVSAIVRRMQPDDSDWLAVRYMVFDLPGHSGTFTERVEVMEKVVSRIGKSWVRMIPQYRVKTESILLNELDRVVFAGGEGLMLHHQDALYQSGRTNMLLKLKPWQDAEARVIGHLPGKGKYKGKLGALLVETAEGVQFRLGTGFSDAQRADPPEVGEWVTYKFTGLTRYGKPRFASFLRLYQPN